MADDAKARTAEEWAEYQCRHRDGYECEEDRLKYARACMSTEAIVRAAQAAARAEALEQAAQVLVEHDKECSLNSCHVESFVEDIRALLRDGARRGGGG